MNRRFATALALGFSCAPFAQVHAQAGSTGTKIEEIVVTAQKRDETAASVPMAIDSFRGDELRALGIEDTRDLGKLVPGFTAGDSGFDTPVYTLRGVGFADSSFGTTSTVGVYADEVSLAYPIMSKGPNLDLRRVEVLKGPQGTLYGRNSTGGAINYIANTPTARFRAGGELSYGSFQRVEGSGYLSGPLAEHVRARFAASIDDSGEGWQISQTRPGDRLGKLNKQAARGIVDWDLSESAMLRFTVAGWIDRSQPQAPYAVQRSAQFELPFPSQFITLLQSLTGVNAGNAFLDPSVANYPLVPGNRNPRIADWNPHPENTYGLHDNFWMASLRPTWNFSDTASLTGLFSFEQVRADGSSLPQGGLDVEDIDQWLHAFIRSYQGEVRAAGRLDGRGGWLLGAGISHDKHHEVDEGLGAENSLNLEVYGDTPPLDKPLFFQKGAAKSDAQLQTESLFADGDWALLDWLKLTLGLRYSREKQDYAGCTYVLADNNSIIPFPFFTAASYFKGGNSTVAQGQCGSLDSHAQAGLFIDRLGEHNLSYRSVLSATPVSNTLLYASYSRGYKSGSFPTVFSVDQQSLQPVTQERLDAYEAGAKLANADRSLQADAALFYYDYKNKQLLTYFHDPLFGPLQYLQNVPKSQVEGAELTTTWVPADRLYLHAAGSTIRTKVVAYQGLDSNGNAFDFAGQAFNYTPRLQGSLSAHYTVPLSIGLNLSPGADFTYTGGTNSSLEHDPVYALPAHRLYDLSLALSPPGHSWSVSVFGRNLGNEFYRKSVIKLGDTVFAYTGMTRTYGLSLTYDLR